MSMIQDGAGTSSLAKVSTKNRLFTAAITETEQRHAVEAGDGYNINTGNISISGTSETAIIYLKNNESRDLVIDSIALGLGTGTASDVGYVTIIRNPTTGTLIDSATNVDMNVNRNFGSSQTLTVDALKGADGETFTNGADLGIIYLPHSSRLFADIGLTLTKGDSIGVKIDPNLSSGTVNVYAALTVHLKDISLEG